MNARPASSTVRRWLSTVLALLAMSAQLVVAFAPLAEGRDGRMASHIESRGAASHYTHSEASCAACQARSIHGATSRPTPPLIRDAIVATAVPTATTRIVSADFHLLDNSRAPPSAI